MDSFIEGLVAAALDEGIEADEDMKRILLFLATNGPLPSAYPAAKRKALQDVMVSTYCAIAKDNAPEGVTALTLGAIMFHLGAEWGALQERVQKQLEVRHVDSGEQGEQETGGPQPGETGTGTGPEG